MLLGVFGASPQSRADDTKESDPVEEVQKILANPELRSKELKSNEGGARVDQNVRELGGSEANVEEIYSITADIMATLVKDVDGDPAKLQVLVQEAMKNPEAFKSKLSPAQIQRIKAVSAKIDAEKKKKP
jgi:hypothetical protein